MSSSALNDLVNNFLKNKPIHDKKEFNNNNIKLLSRKEKYPYDCMNCFEKFNGTSVPTEEKFCSILDDEYICDKDYNHVCLHAKVILGSSKR